jgi:hypothetical protein
MSSALDDVADAADEVADQQRRVARVARAMQRRRERGASWAAALDQQGSPSIVDLLRRSGRHLAEATATFTVTLARELSREGESRRQIARRLGVSHQRVSAMVNRTRRSARS